ncbi:TPR-like protein [Fomitiporia mediterranea MF3/22]|uniref:TPR-like protein n=1 Tax=Fomitiporia mediterranea (strain MF3/22) TaxID=694068 RepID=UPI00044086AC|nr:TPR-like protein [Fomitiporia mediterranea MF3/22]EJC99359.1 TPR-like protein [Fomitiporia mediterranea MF3/22]
MKYYVDLEWICRGLVCLGVKHWSRFEQSGEREGLDRSISYWRIALGLCPESHPSRNEICSNLGNALFLRFENFGNIDDLHEAVDCHRVVLELRPHGHPERYLSLNQLAVALHTRFEQDGQTTDLDEAIEYHRAALELRPTGHLGHSDSLNNLGNTLYARFKLHGQKIDLDEAVEHHRTALERRPNGHPNCPVSLDSLANALSARFERHGQLGDIDEAIKYHRAALDLCPAGHSNRPPFLLNLASTLRIRFDQHGQTTDLDEAIEHLRTVLELFHVGHPYHYGSLSSLAGTLQTRFEQYGRMKDLDEAIKHHSTVLKLLPDDHLWRSMMLSNLGTALSIRFEQYGQTIDLDEAIKYHCTALELCPDSHLDRFTFLHNLANALRIRFVQYGRTIDLDEAINHNRAALKLLPDRHPDRSMSLSNLGTVLHTRFEQDGQTTDLDEAIEYQRAALELQPVSSPAYSGSLNNLALYLRTRFEQRGQIADLDESIENNRAALERLSVEHPDLPKSLNNLALSLRTRFKQNGQTTDLDEAIRHLYAALKFWPVGHPNRSGLLANLGLSLFRRFDQSGLMECFDECIQLLEHASVHRFSSLIGRLKIADLWAKIARKYSHHTTSNAYREAMMLLQRILVISPSLPAQHDFLNEKSDYISLALDAVAYAVDKNRLEEAIEILEQGRGLLWSQMRGLRAPLDGLAEVNKELADRFSDISCQLENLAMSPTESQLKRRLSTEQEELIGEIRRIPGFQSFLEATPFNVLQQAASEGPVIVVNHSKYRSDVLIVPSHEDKPVACIPLDGKFYKDSTELCAKLVGTRTISGAYSAEYDQMLRQAMRTLWDRVVSKVVDKLNELGIAEGSRIWWCPTSVLSALPFHAAGPFMDEDGTAAYLLDKYISSYTPTLGALIDAQSSCRNGGESSALIVGDKSLPSATKEICNIKNCGIQVKLLNSKTSHDAVIKTLQKARWVHFVCHGGLDPKPFNSSFKVSEHGLTLLDIIQAKLPNAEFAFLSACHTAEQSHNGTYDEALHLAAAMQFSGFRSVIGSMWELLDVDGPFFAKTVYEYMCNCNEGEARYKRAAAGLRKAAVELKGRAEVRAERWVNLIHIGA